MRLIDADDVIKTISHYLGKKLYALYPNDKMPDFDKGVIDGYARARSIVFETPTAYPVNHGRWIPFGAERNQLWECSECGMVQQDDFYYCPYCGSLMDEVSE